MPAQKVYGMQHAPAPGLEEDDYIPMVPIVYVRWGREQNFVQIVTKATDANGGRYAAGDETDFTDGMYVDLDREAINRLIRNLRRARDQAFGRDE